VGLTGLIYAAIVVAWAAYLVPLALRRHDEAAHGRSIERFSSAMRVLARRGQGMESNSDRMIVTPPRTEDRLLMPTLAARDAEATLPDVGKRPSRASQRAAAARRRRVLAVLGTLTLVVVAVCAVGLFPWWSLAGPVVLVGGFLVIARTQVRRADEAFWTIAAAEQRPASNVVQRGAPARVNASHGASKSTVEVSAATARSAEGAEGEGDDEPTVTLSAEQITAAAAAAIAQPRVEAVALRTSDGGSLWDPLPITLPTYVDKPAARRTIRTIELGEPGTWSAGHRSDDSAVVEAADKVVKDPNELAEERPRAVNG